MQPPPLADPDRISIHRLREIFLVFLRLGLTSFGGPVAHLGYFRAECVARRRWLDDHAYADLVALSQFLPGPSSSQVGIGLGLMRGGLAGAVLAWVGFTLPSALLLVVLALVVGHLDPSLTGPWLHGLKVVAVAVVAQALWVMGRQLCPDRSRASLGLAAAIVTAVWPSTWTQIGVIAGSALLGTLLLKPGPALPHRPFAVRISRSGALFALALFVAMLLLPSAWLSPLGRQLEGCYRAGALVFGGGHVVLPMLQAVVVPPGWVSNALFVAGYGAAQAMPGPLFAIAAFLGAVSSASPGPWSGAALTLVALFLPGWLLMVAALPLWDKLRGHPSMRQALQGVNAGVVGLLLAAFYNPVWSSAVHSLADLALAAAALLLLLRKAPPWLVVLLCATVTGIGLR